MILVIDNYDSFTYNLVQYLGELGAELEVVRNDAVDVERIVAMTPERIVISPGPGTPDQAGVSLEVIRRLGPTDRKSTRLNSSHGYISYAVFCLKKKKQKSHYASCNAL